MIDLIELNRLPVLSLLPHCIIVNNSRQWSSDSGNQIMVQDTYKGGYTLSATNPARAPLTFGSLKLLISTNLRRSIENPRTFSEFVNMSTRRENLAIMEMSGAALIMASLSKNIKKGRRWWHTELFKKRNSSELMMDLKFICCL